MSKEFESKRIPKPTDRNRDKLISLYRESQNCATLEQRQFAFGLLRQSVVEAGYDLEATEKSIMEGDYGNQVKEVYLHARKRVGNSLDTESQEFYDKNEELLRGII